MKCRTQLSTNWARIRADGSPGQLAPGLPVRYLQPPTCHPGCRSDSFSSTNSQDIGFADELKASAPVNIHVLTNDALELEGVRFLGCTLWTDFRLHGDGEIEREVAGPTVVVTHHLPAPTSVAKRYANDPLNPVFASRLQDVIEKYRPELWIHGHTHVPVDYRLFDTRIVCNPCGYPGENRRSEFNDSLVVCVGFRSRGSG